MNQPLHRVLWTAINAVVRFVVYGALRAITRR